MNAQGFRALVLGATIVAGGAAVAIAQVTTTSTYDPAQLPALQGTVARYDVTPRGDVDGLILQDGTEVHFPPHLGMQVVAIVRPGDAVTVHGLKARVLPLVQAMSVTADASGKTVIDRGPGDGPRQPRGAEGGKPPHGPGRPGDEGADLQVQGIVKMALHGPRGEVNGVMLEDGTLIHMPPREAERLSAQLQPGKTIAVRGNGVDNTLGRSIGARFFGPTADQLTALAVPPPPGPRGRGPGAVDTADGRPPAPPSDAAPAPRPSATPGAPSAVPPAR